MSTNIADRAAQVLREIDAALALAENATPGPWRNKHHQYTSEIFSDGWGPIAQMHSSPAPIQERNNTSDFIAASRTLLPASLRCLKTAIEGLLGQHGYLEQCFCGCTTANEAGDRDICSRCIALDQSEQSLTTLCDQWRAAK
jgi:hypothetical protein